jgi:translation initiation factor IF-2
MADVVIEVEPVVAAPEPSVQEPTTAEPTVEARTPEPTVGDTTTEPSVEAKTPEPTVGETTTEPVPAETTAQPVPESEPSVQTTLDVDSEEAGPVEEEPVEESSNVIAFAKPQIAVKELAEKMGVKPNHLIAELMKMNIFASINQDIDIKIAKQIGEKHGFIVDLKKKEKAPAKPVENALPEDL